MGPIILNLTEQQPAQLCLHLMITQSVGSFFGHDNEILGWQKGLVAPEKFPQQAFYPIALHCFAQTPGHHQTQSGRLGPRGRQNNPEVARIKPFALDLRPEEVAAAAEPIRLGKTGCPFNSWVRDGGGAPNGFFRGMAQRGPHLSDREAFPASGPTAF
jgi:hypothetical protein